MSTDHLLHESAATLAGALSGTQRLYLLADASGLPRISSLWPRIGALRWASVLGTEQAQPDGASPLLVDVSEANTSPEQRRMLHALYDRGRYANCFSLLCSDLTLSDLVQALRQRTQAELPDRMSVLLRYFDTRTLPLLPRLLTVAQYASFMTCVRAWHFIDRHGQVQTLQAPLAVTALAEFSAPMVFDVAQQRLLIDDGNTDAVIDQLIEQRHPALFNSTPPQQFELVSPLVQAAAALGITDFHDVLRYCCTALSQGEGFEQRAPWAERLALHRRGAMTLQDALDDDA